MNEIWKDIEGFEGIYQISNLGQVKSVRKNKILKPTLDKDGYRKLTLSYKGKRSYPRICRLVGLYFVENPHNLPIINHKNRIKTDDYADNLEWTSIRENTCHGIIKKELPIGVTSYRNKFRARIEVDKKSVHIGYYNTPEEASTAYLNKLKELNIENRYA